jgi:hypothetical protein
MIEKLGVEKKQLVEELQSEYSRKRLAQHDLEKTGASAPQRAQAANELDQIKSRLDELTKPE